MLLMWCFAAFGILALVRLSLVAKLQEEIHNFIFKDPNCVNDWGNPEKLEYLQRLDWKDTELESFEQMMVKFWIWPMSRFIQGSFEQKFFEWKMAGKPTKT